MKKIFIILFSVFLIILLQNSVFPHFRANGSVPNLLLIFILFWAVLENKNKHYSLLAGFFCGIGADIFSPYFFGVFTFLFLAYVFLIKRMKPFFETERVVSFTLFWGAALLLYYVLFSLLSFLLTGARVFYFDVFGLLYTLAIGFVIYFLIYVFCKTQLAK